jgi:hypothetical protein
MYCIRQYIKSKGFHAGTTLKYVRCDIETDIVDIQFNYMNDTLSFIFYFCDIKSEICNTLKTGRNLKSLMSRGKFNFF